MSEHDYGTLLFVAVFCACVFALAWFIVEVNVLPSPDSIPLMTEEEFSSLRAVRESERRAVLAVQHPEWPWHLINACKIQLGMTGEMVLVSLGKPTRVNRSVGSWGTSEQWVYGSYTSWSSPTYLYFTNGILTSWSETD